MRYGDNNYLKYKIALYKMLYKCDYCDYSTKRLRDLKRHNDRKTPCYKENKEEICNLEVPQNINVLPQNINVLPQNINGLPQNINVLPQNINVHPQNINGNSRVEDTTTFKCIKCKKLFDRRDNLKRHEIKCDGYDRKQCRICLRMFTTAQGKHQHIKYVKCSPPIQQHNNQTINNNCNNTTNNTTNNNNNIYNINVLRTDFDKITKEDIENMVSRIAKEEYLNMVNKNIDIGKYVIPRTMKHIYFNDDFPEMQVLKKERRNDKMVEVYVGEGKWEKRMMNDVCRDVISQVENFHTEYLRYIEEKYKDVKIGSAKWKQLMRPIKTFGNTMLWYNGFRGDEIESIGVELNYPDDDDEETERERDRKNKEMEKLVGEKVYDESKIIERATQIMLGQNKSSLI